MEAEVRPEPAADEREAILVALQAPVEAAAGGYESEWRRASLREGAERQPGFGSLAP